MTYPITELFAWIVDDPSGQHGIVAGSTGGLMIMQACTGKRGLATGERMRDLAGTAREVTGLPVMLQRFVLAETVETLQP